MGNDLKLRRWQADDCRLLHEWRLHPANRRWFGDSSEISFEAHQAWFERFMADKSRFGFILEEDGRPVAQIRFDPAEMPGCYRISLSTAPDCAGRGLGSQILRMGCASAEMQEGATLFVAETRIDNLPSQKVFQRQGFVEAGRHVYAGAEHLAWIAPSVRLVAGHRLSLRIWAEESLVESLRRMLGVTGLADISDEAEVSLFFDAASSDDAEGGMPVFHFNTTAGVILDLANDVPFMLSLPVEFKTVAVAVAQTAAALHHTATRA